MGGGWAFSSVLFFSRLLQFFYRNQRCFSTPSKNHHCKRGKKAIGTQGVFQHRQFPVSFVRSSSVRRIVQIKYKIFPLNFFIKMSLHNLDGASDCPTARHGVPLDNTKLGVNAPMRSITTSNEFFAFYRLGIRFPNCRFAKHYAEQINYAKRWY